jgi:hypothetical protein
MSAAHLTEESTAAWPDTSQVIRIQPSEPDYTAGSQCPATAPLVAADTADNIAITDKVDTSGSAVTAAALAATATAALTADESGGNSRA